MEQQSLHSNKKAVLIVGTGVTISNYDLTDCYIVSVDRGSYYALNSSVKIDYAIGDFDSVTDSEFLGIRKVIGNVEVLSEEKDVTDTLAAVEHVISKGYTDILILGGISGNRIEHFYANLLILRKYPNIVMRDDFSEMKVIKSGTTFTCTNCYYSFFALKETKNLTLKGFKYPLTKYNMTENDAIGISNELVEEKGTITFDSGSILSIVTKI